MKKKSFLILLFFYLTNNIFSQAPNLFKYQSVARNSSNEIVENSSLNLRISILDLSSTGSIVFQETHNVTTNNFGLFSISIGGGTNIFGQIENVAWGIGAKFIQVEADFLGGVNYELFGTSELLSVPYALYSNFSNAPLMPNGENIGNTTYWNGTEWVINSSNLFNSGVKIGVGTITPTQKFEVNGNISISKDSSYMIDNQAIISNKGNSNIFVGNNVGLSTTIGFKNAFLGYNSGLVNLIGSQNTFIGAETGSANIDGMMNSFLGRRAGFSNISGNENTFLGAYTGQSNIDGFHNSFLGVSTGNSNTNGSENTFLGAHAGYNNTLGNNNTFVGNFSGLINDFGSNNTFLGFETNATNSGLTNSTAIGAGAIVNASNTIVIGNTAVNSIGGQVGWSTLSDKRLKTNIQKSELGLNFILKLRPVTYTYITKGQENKVYSGLIAQEVEQSLRELNQEFSGIVKPQTDLDFYSIRYAEFVIPLINSIQEQQKQIDELILKNNELTRLIELLILESKK